jgi:hypothetical protein
LIKLERYAILRVALNPPEFAFSQLVLCRILNVSRRGDRATDRQQDIFDFLSRAICRRQI